MKSMDVIVGNELVRGFGDDSKIQCLHARLCGWCSQILMGPWLDFGEPQTFPPWVWLDCLAWNLFLGLIFGKEDSCVLLRISELVIPLMSGYQSCNFLPQSTRNATNPEFSQNGRW